MRKILIIIFVLTANLLLAQNNGAEQVIVPLSNPEHTGLLSITHFNGSISITGYDGDVVIITASLQHKTQQSDPVRSNNKMKRIYTHSIQLSATEKDNKVIVKTNSEVNTINLDIKVPQRFSVNIKSIDQGNIDVVNLNGEMEISNNDGDVKILRASGSAVINTLDGDIFVKFIEVSADVPMAFSAMDGTIDVTFPEDLKAFLKIKSDYGKIFSDFEMTIEKRKLKTEKSDDTGIYKVSLEDWTCGRINGGEAEIRLNSVDGNIFIRKQ